ncbi:histidine kinase N-terminal 7TM domain-containing diguanylate cyclase [Pectinatus sottacetonis]|uniref:histidine kinase N-terminal 7TM domain-containing diguanylate cyclase n=1 Tax=Pectinatus sottacetonis TaxID=1002795 RepID=UPI0018C74286|nr:diguanylate cyclase [Pectinatus sottacetonis]
MSFLILASVCIMAWNKKNIKLAKSIFFLSLSAAIYSFGYTCELSSNTLNAIKFWLHIENIGAPFIPTAWVILALQHTNLNFKYDKMLNAFLLTMSSITFILGSTTEIHHLYYKAVYLNPAAPFSTALIIPGIWYHVHDIFNNLAILTGNIIYIIFWRKSAYPQNQQALIFLLGSLFPWIVEIIYICGYIPWGLDPSPATFIVPGILYGWAIFSLNLFEIAPLAQKVIFQTLSDAILVFDAKGHLATFNFSCKKLFLYLTKKHINALGLTIFYNNPQICQLIQKDSDKVLITDINDKTYHIKRTNLINYDKSVGFMLILHDITYFSDKLNSLQIKASTDPLTGISNRAKLNEDIAKLLAKTTEENISIALLIIDIDHFKTINDTFGHTVGDTILKIFSSTCKNNLRKNDILGRYGGDEFIIILSPSDPSAAFKTAEKIRSVTAAKKIIINSHNNIKITVSIGITVTNIQEPFSDINTLIKQADTALYEAKKLGRNNVKLYTGEQSEQ